jgi:hypothetical protein
LAEGLEDFGDFGQVLAGCVNVRFQTQGFSDNPMLFLKGRNGDRNFMHYVPVEGRHSCTRVVSFQAEIS